LSYENCVGWNAAPDGRFPFSSCLFAHTLFTSMVKARACRSSTDPRISSYLK
jgi:hypothetical protein